MIFVWTLESVVQAAILGVLALLFTLYLLLRLAMVWRAKWKKWWG